MTKYQLAKLIQMANGFTSRERIQKTVCLLQEADCPLDIKFRFGPYSEELAWLLDSMTNVELLIERHYHTPNGVRYAYTFNQEMQCRLEAYETGSGAEMRTELEQYQVLLERLQKTHLHKLTGDDS